MSRAMSQDELRRRVDKIISHSDDDERAHSEEDGLHRDVIEAFCPDWVQFEIERLNNADFGRWCA